MLCCSPFLDHFHSISKQSRWWGNPAHFTWAPIHYQAFRPACNLRQGEAGVGGSAMALLPSPDFPLLPKPVHQHRAPHLLPSTSTHTFLLQEVTQDTVLVCIHWLISLISASRKYSFVCFFPPSIYDFPPQTMKRNMLQSTQSPGFGTDICIQTTWQSTEKGEKALQTVICTRPCTSSVWKGTNLIVSNLQSCLLLTRVL